MRKSADSSKPNATNEKKAKPRIGGRRGKAEPDFSASPLCARQLTAGYGGDVILHDVDFCAEAGTVTVLIGKNGCGKSTLLRALSGRLAATGGQVRVYGRSVSEYSPTAMARLVSYMPQVRDVPDLPVKTMVEHGRYAYLGFPRILSQADRTAVTDALCLLGAADYAGRNTSELSGGQRQRVYLAMAVCQQARVLLLDEPTTYLDLRDSHIVLAKLRALAQDKAVVMVLHDLNAALRIADKICLLDEGRVVAFDTPQKVYESGAIQRVYGVCSRVVRAGGEAQYLFYNEKSETST